MFETKKDIKTINERLDAIDRRIKNLDSRTTSVENDIGLIKVVLKNVTKTKKK